MLLLAPVVGFDAAIPSQLLGEAFDDAECPRYDVTVAGLTTDPVATDSGWAMVPTADASALARADTVIVPGTRLPSARLHGVLDDDVHAALASVRPGTRLVSICTGAFVLAAAGLFDGRPATTHWRRAAEFRALYPDVLLDENRLFVDDGDELSSAGLAAGVVPPWRDGGQDQFIERPVPDTGHASTAAVRQWAIEHLDEPLDVARLAAAARMSVRTFNRRFTSETGRSPGAWVLAQRVERARHLLEATDLGVDDVALRVGLGSGASLRQHLRASLGVAPLAYRRTFRGTPAG
ncbi:GlxA family transcriptional regulator [uncultured Jatrophihabitans sp.]|uniref:GlxA family transcriptional regulator n=1 Tax=uncultured Jatrophihabitans sp. TaxID=1610747 RepID=UPI0035CB92D6